MSDLAATNGHAARLLAPERLAVLAAALLAIDDARQEQLVDGVPWIDRHRCHRLLAKLAADGIEPAEDDVAIATLELLAEMGVLR